MNMETQIGNLCANLHNRINTIRKLTKYTTFHTRLQFANANIAGKMFYMMPLYVGLNNIQKNKLHKIIMRTTRCVLNNYSYRINIAMNF